MNNIRVLCLLFLCLFTTDIKAYIKDDTNEKILLINKLEKYEFDCHNSFQDKLTSESKKYFQTQSKKFVDEESSFFNLWGEVFHYFESDVKKRARWKSRVEMYFRTTEYNTFIQSLISEHISSTNAQRKEQLDKLFDVSGKEDLNIRIHKMNSIELNRSTFANVKKEINNMVLNEVIPEILENLLGPFLIFPLLVFIFGSAVVAKYSSSISGILLVLLMIFSVVQSIRFSNRLEKNLCDSFAEYSDEQLNIIPQLNYNTVHYYKSFKK